MAAVNETWGPAERQRLLDDLFSVGKGKAMGYLPVSTLEKCGENVPELESRLASRGLFTYHSRWGHVASGALYAAHAPSLSELLEKHSGICMSVGWPSTPADFVMFVSEYVVKEDENPDLYDLIARAFGKRV